MEGWLAMEILMGLDGGSLNVWLWKCMSVIQCVDRFGLAVEDDTSWTWYGDWSFLRHRRELVASSIMPGVKKSESFLSLNTFHFLCKTPKNF